MEANQSVAGVRRTSLKKQVLAVDEVAAISFKLASCEDGPSFLASGDGGKRATSGHRRRWAVVPPVGGGLSRLGVPSFSGRSCSWGDDLHLRFVASLAGQ